MLTGFSEHVCKLVALRVMLSYHRTTVTIVPQSTIQSIVRWLRHLLTPIGSGRVKKCVPLDEPQSMGASNWSKDCGSAHDNNSSSTMTGIRARKSLSREWT